MSNAVTVPADELAAMRATIEAQAAELERLRVAIKSCKTGGYRDIDGDFRKTWWFDEKLVSAAIAKEKTS